MVDQQASVKFILFTDIHRSTHLWENYQNEYLSSLEKHNEITERFVIENGGQIMKNLGDGYIALFDGADGCISAAVSIQLELKAIPAFPDESTFKLRVVCHGGPLHRLETGAGYFGTALNRASRICAICNPQQTLLSEAVVSLADKQFLEMVSLEDLGIHHLRDLAAPEKLWQLNHPEFEIDKFRSLASLNNRPNNLWIQPNEFIGRETELDELASLVRDNRVVSIIAPGGYGKSRISAQLCANLLDSFDNGVFIAELAPLDDHRRIASVIADATSFQFYGKQEPEQQIINFLRSKKMLLCLDNFEQVLEGSSFIADILKEAPGVNVVVTSRERLSIAGEQIYKLQPLPVSDGDSDAVMLFTDRANLVDTEFVPDIPKVITICNMLFGIPLAIELAAAWMDSFSLDEMIGELGEQLELESRFDNIPDRHKSLRASLDWSWNLLTEGQRRTLMGLATFKGGAFSEAAGAVIGLKGMKLRKELAKLMDKSWLHTREEISTSPTGWVNKQQVLGKTRWYLRDASSREYAYEKLEDTKDDPGSFHESAIMAHVDYFSALVELEGPRLEGDGTPTGQMEALDTFQIEMENNTEALNSLMQRIGQSVSEYSASDIETLLLPIVRWLWLSLGRKNKALVTLPIYQKLERELPANSNLELRGWTLVGLGYASWDLGMMDDANLYAKKCLQLVAPPSPGVELKDTCTEAGATTKASNFGSTSFGNTAVPGGAKNAEVTRIDVGITALHATTLQLQGILHHVQGRIDEAKKCYEATLEIWREIGDLSGEGLALNALGALLKTQGLMDETRECYETSLAICREIGNRRGEGLCLNNLGVLHIDQGRINEARECYETSLAICREIGNRRGEGLGINNLGLLHYDQGRIDEARECFETSLKICHELGLRMGEGTSLNNLANVHIDQGRMEEARECIDSSLNIRREIGDRYGEGYALDSYAGLLLETGELAQAREMLVQSQQISEELSLKEILASLHSKWARYWLLCSILTPEAERHGDTYEEADATKIPASPQAALDKALYHLDIGKNFAAEIGASPLSQIRQKITAARRAIIEFAKEHGLTESVNDLVDEQQAEDSHRK